jgi:hypothetical protein
VARHTSFGSTIAARTLCAAYSPKSPFRRDTWRPEAFFDCLQHSFVFVSFPHELGCWRRSSVHQVVYS